MLTSLEEKDGYDVVGRYNNNMYDAVFDKLFSRYSEEEEADED